MSCGISFVGQVLWYHKDGMAFPILSHDRDRDVDDVDDDVFIVVTIVLITTIYSISIIRSVFIVYYHDTVVLRIVIT